jgi:hypothetical protein
MRVPALSKAVVVGTLVSVLAACSAKSPPPAPPAAEPARPITLEGAKTPETGPPHEDAAPAPSKSP